jgi:acetyltransferase
MQPPPIKHEWTHNDGTLVTIRPIRPEDRDIERAFVRDLSSNSSYFRFLSIVKDLSPRLLDKFTQVDYPREMALIATIPAETGEQEIGVARYAPGSSEDTVEFAIVVADYWQGHGIGRELLRHLFTVAEVVGHKQIEGIVLRANTKMLQLVRQMGFTISPYPGDATLVQVGKDLRTSEPDT